MTFFGKLFGREARDERRRAGQAAYRARLLAPQWDAVEEALGRPVPAILRTGGDTDLAASSLATFLGWRREPRQS